MKRAVGGRGGTRYTGGVFPQHRATGSRGRRGRPGTAPAPVPAPAPAGPPAHKHARAPVDAGYSARRMDTPSSASSSEAKSAMARLALARLLAANGNRLRSAVLDSKLPTFNLPDLPINLDNIPSTRNRVPSGHHHVAFHKRLVVGADVADFSVGHMILQRCECSESSADG